MPMISYSYDNAFVRGAIFASARYNTMNNQVYGGSFFPGDSYPRGNNP